MLTTTHTTEASLARALAQGLRDLGIRFPAVFPYNRFEHERTLWWLSPKGAPAFAVAKLAVFRNAEQELEVGMVIEKGFAIADKSLVPARQRLDKSWEWHAVTARMRESGFSALLDKLAPCDVRLRVDAAPMGTRGAADHLVFATAPWSRLRYDSDSPTSRPLQSVASADSPLALIDALNANPQRDFCWYDLNVTAPLRPASGDGHPSADDDVVIERFLLPLITWLWPALPAALR